MMEIINQFKQHLQDRGLKESTIQSYMQDIKILLFHMDSTTPAAVTEDEMKKILERLKGVKKESGIIRWMVAVRHFFDFCVLQGLRGDNPVESLRISRPPRTKRPDQPQSVAEALLLEESPHFSFMKYRNRALMALICGSQIKIQEMCTLTMGNFDPIRQQIRLPSGKSYKLSDQALKLLNEYLAFFVYRNTSADTLLFASCSGKPLTRQGLWKIFKRVSQKAGLDEKLSPVKMRGALRDAEHMGYAYAAR